MAGAGLRGPGSDGRLREPVQIAGKYTLDEPFEVGWGNIVLDVTPRGLRTPTLRQRDVTFTVHHRLLDGDVVIETDRGSRTLPMSDGSLASFYAAFCGAAGEFGLRRPAGILWLRAGHTWLCIEA
ncbi:DUF5996 family protein [Streptomyces sp. NPDC057611]|uniref:DUF5996 family protein n=1 Tax=Streptomyces sp. NPDC057611 TaxID=3346182 RepID=UPI0036837451